LMCARGCDFGTHHLTEGIKMEQLTGLFEGFSVNTNLLWYALGILMVCDLVTGLAKAYKKEGQVSSSKLRDGGFKKCAMMAVSLLSAGISKLFGDNNFVIANGVVAYYVYTELVSIIENLIVLEVPLPPMIKKIVGEKKA